MMEIFLELFLSLLFRDIPSIGTHLEEESPQSHYTDLDDLGGDFTVVAIGQRINLLVILAELCDLFLLQQFLVEM